MRNCCILSHGTHKDIDIKRNVLDLTFIYNTLQLVYMCSNLIKTECKLQLKLNKE